MIPTDDKANGFSDKLLITVIKIFKGKEYLDRLTRLVVLGLIIEEREKKLQEINDALDKLDNDSVE